MVHSNYGTWLAEYAKSGKATSDMKASIGRSCAQNKALGLTESNAEIEAARKRGVEDPESKVSTSPDSSSSL